MSLTSASGAAYKYQRSPWNADAWASPLLLVSPARSLLGEVPSLGTHRAALPPSQEPLGKSCFAELPSEVDAQHHLTQWMGGYRCDLT